MYKSGKCKLTNNELLFIELITNTKSRKTINKQIQFLQQIRFIKYNTKTNYYHLKSFDKIRAENHWENRLAFPVTISNYHNIKAITGAVLFAYLHKDFWRKAKRDKSVLIKGCTYHFVNSKFNYKQQPAPVSVIGAEQLFNIPRATASRLKKEANKKQLLVVKKNFTEKTQNKIDLLLFCKHNNLKPNIVFSNGFYYLQQIDTIYPLFYFTKRKSLET